MRTPSDQFRREQSRESLKSFLETYLHRKVPLPWIARRMEIVAALQTVIVEGGTEDIRVERGVGTTTLINGALLWAALYVHRQFIVICGPDQIAATRHCENIRIEMECNPLIVADFPHIVYASESPCRVTPKGIMGQLRGIGEVNEAGTVTVPDLVIVDGYHTQASLRSDSQTAARQRVLRQDVPALFGLSRNPAYAIFESFE